LWNDDVVDVDGGGFADGPVATIAGAATIVFLQSSEDALDSVPNDSLLRLDGVLLLMLLLKEFDRSLFVVLAPSFDVLLVLLTENDLRCRRLFFTLLLLLLFDDDCIVTVAPVVRSR
jgi:hypothetical protein